MKEKNSEHFPEHYSKVIQAGGYVPVQVQSLNDEEKEDVKVIAFISNRILTLVFITARPTVT
jgi:hypothetical protein